MRQGQQNRRGRGRGGNSNSSNNSRKGQSPLSRNFESSGPDVKIRGTASQIAEKYAALARDASSSGDTIMAENYLQHAEHYNRIIMAAQAQTAQPAVPNGGEAVQAVNGVHRGTRDGGAAGREQSQPQINAQPSQEPVPQPASAESDQPSDVQPAVAKEPVTDAATASAPKADAGSDAGSEAETGKRRRRRYPGNGASRSSASENDGANGKAADAQNEDHTSDEATA
jgi:hypothetical protein